MREPSIVFFRGRGGFEMVWIFKLFWISKWVWNDFLRTDYRLTENPSRGESSRALCCCGGSDTFTLQQRRPFDWSTLLSSQLITTRTNNSSKMVSKKAVRWLTPEGAANNPVRPRWCQSAKPKQSLKREREKTTRRQGYGTFLRVQASRTRSVESCRDLGALWLSLLMALVLVVWRYYIIFSLHPLGMLVLFRPWLFLTLL